jgi:hypothetical protein
VTQCDTLSTTEKEDEEEEKEKPLLFLLFPLG